MSNTCWQSNLSFPFLFLLPLLFTFFTSSVCLSVLLLGQSASCLICQSFFPFIEAKAYPSDRHNARTNQKREWKRMDALFPSCKSSVSGSILNLSLTDDARLDPYHFSSQFNMMAAT